MVSGRRQPLPVTGHDGIWMVSSREALNFVVVDQNALTDAPRLDRATFYQVVESAKAYREKGGSLLAADEDRLKGDLRHDDTYLDRAKSAVSWF